MNPGEGAGLSPRNRGLTILVGAAFLVLLNLGMVRYLREYYAVVFPFAFGIAPLGVALVLSGTSPEDIRAGKVGRPWLLVVAVLMVAGAIGGLFANQVLADRAPSRRSGWAGGLGVSPIVTGPRCQRLAGRGLTRRRRCS